MESEPTALRGSLKGLNLRGGTGMRVMNLVLAVEVEDHVAEHDPRLQVVLAKLEDLLNHEEFTGGVVQSIYDTRIEEDEV